MNIKKDVTELIGNTPMVYLSKMSEAHGVSAEIIGKLEFANPGGSVKDRIALNMIMEAEKAGLLDLETVIIEPTSGNTGIGLASIASARGYRIILTMPESMSLERRRLLASYGAELVLTDKTKGMKGAIEMANHLAGQYEKSFIPGQFDNPNNPAIHQKTTAVEILRDTENQLDVFVTGVGTGGTLTGVGSVLKEQLELIHIVAVEPDSSAVLSGEKPSAHGIQGIGAGFIPNVLDTKVYNEVIRVTDEQAKMTAREIARREGLLVGISSGANVFAALELAKRDEFKGKRIVTVLCDTGERYLSTGVFE